jgi:hypothetical protein
MKDASDIKTRLTGKQISLVEILDEGKRIKEAASFLLSKKSNSLLSFYSPIRTREALNSFVQEASSVFALPFQKEEGEFGILLDALGLEKPSKEAIASYIEYGKKYLKGKKVEGNKCIPAFMADADYLEDELKQVANEAGFAEFLEPSKIFASKANIILSFGHLAPFLIKGATARASSYEHMRRNSTGKSFLSGIGKAFGGDRDASLNALFNPNIIKDGYIGFGYMSPVLSLNITPFFDYSLALEEMKTISSEAPSEYIGE